MTQEELLAERQGARVATSLSARTDLLVIGEKPGSKAAQARELGVAVVDEREFSALVGAGPSGAPSASTPLAQ